jgi:hypothetical protein
VHGVYIVPLPPQAAQLDVPVCYAEAREHREVAVPQIQLGHYVSVVVGVVVVVVGVVVVVVGVEVVGGNGNSSS